VTDKAVAATCTESGLTEGKHCSVCNEVLVAQEVIPATGHTFVDGECSCGAEDPDYVKPTEPSEPEETEPTEPSEPEETEPTEPSEPEETEPTKPSEPEETEPTKPSEPEETEPTKPTEPEETKPTEPSHVCEFQAEVTKPTCTEKGYTTYTCSCGESYVGDEVAALGHTEVIDKAVAATCAAEGKTEGKHCGTCGEILVAQESVEKLAHKWSKWEVTEPTSKKEGLRTRECAVCGEVEKEILSKLSGKFEDVAEDQYYALPVDWAVQKGVTTGMSATIFAPDAECTRGQIVTFLWRAAGQPEPSSSKNPFKDVKSSDYYYKAVLWAVEEGITTGTSADTFSPDSGCTRAQVATFLWRAQGKPAAASKNPFSDVKKGEYYYEAVIWAVENGVTTGTSATTFAPNATCTRGQIVTFLYRAIA